MKIYNYDRQTGAYLGPSDADESPMEPGCFMVPAFATKIAPPDVDASKVAVFNPVKNAWEAHAVALEPIAPEPAAMTFDEKVLVWRKSLQKYLDTAAFAFGFDDMAEAVTYAEEPAVPKYQIQGRALRAWRSKSWVAFDVLVADIKGGVVPPPADADALVAYMPILSMPSFDGSPPVVEIPVASLVVPVIPEVPGERIEVAAPAEGFHDAPPAADVPESAL